MADDEKSLAIPEEVKARITINRLLCAFSGKIGKGLARFTDVALGTFEVDTLTRARIRAVVGQGGALALTAMGAPEGAISILSSFESHCSTDPNASPEQGMNPKDV